MSKFTTIWSCIFVLLFSCKAGENTIDPFVGQPNVYLNSTEGPNVLTRKTFAVLPAHIFLNTRHPGTERAERRTKMASEGEIGWMNYYQELIAEYPQNFTVRLQPADSTLLLMEKAGITTSGLPYVDRQRLLEILNVDALLTHEIHVNIYSSTTEDVLTNTALVIAIAGAASTGGMPTGNFTKSNPTNSIEFIKVYVKNLEKPVWSYYGNSGYNGKNVPKPDKNSLKTLKMLGFPFIK